MKDIYYKEASSGQTSMASRNLQERWSDVEYLADLRSEDTVFDVGCAEGLLTLEVASMVASVHAIESDDARYEKATRVLAETPNVTLEHASIDEINLTTKYDVVLFLGVLHHLEPESHQHVLEKLCSVTGRQLVIRTPIQNFRDRWDNLSVQAEVVERERVNRLQMIVDTCQRRDLKTHVFATNNLKNGNLIISNRMSEDIFHKDRYPPLSLSITQP